jgi:hypothetical protein
MSISSTAREAVDFVVEPLRDMFSMVYWRWDVVEVDVVEVWDAVEV